MKLFFTLAVLAFYNPLWAQTPIDSLKQLLNEDLTEDQRIEVYEELEDLFDEISGDSAIFYCQKALDIAIKNQNHVKTAILTADMAYSYYRTGDLDKCINLSLESIMLLDKIGREEYKSIAFHNLGICYTDRGEYERAIDYLKQAIDLNRKYKDELGIAKTLNPLGGVYFYTGRLDSALICFEESFRICKKLNNLSSEKIAIGNIGAIYYMKGDYQTAIKYYQEALEYDKEYGEEVHFPADMSNLGEAYIAVDRFDEGIDLYDQAVAYTYKLNDENFRSELYKMYADAYVKKGDYRKAYAYQVKFKDLKDSVRRKLFDKDVADLEVKYETAKKDQAIAEQESRLLNQRLWLFGVISFFLMVLAAAYLLYNRYRLRQKAAMDAAIITEQQLGLNAVIEAQETERRRIAKDLHDSIAQQLVALKLSLLKWGGQLNVIPEAEKQEFNDLTEQLSQTCKEVRNLSHVMLPPTLETMGLVPSLQILVENSLSKAGIEASFEHFNTKEKYAERTELGIYRVAQELIGNVLKHAEASQVIMQLYQSGTHLILRMEDNGKGFDFEQARKKGSMGLLNILSRVSLLHGSFTAEKGAKSGTVSLLKIPV